MRLGVCVSLEQSSAMKAAGWDYIEESVQGLLQGLTPDESWKGAAAVAASKLPISAANMLVPAVLRITGPTADLAALEKYIATVTLRAAKTGITTLVFGSGGARNIPEGFNRDAGRRQIVAFAKIAAEHAGRNGVTIVLEPLNRGECNVVNSVAEAMTYVKEVGHPNFRCLVDSYHFWLENEPLSDLEAAMPWIGHVHVADKIGRTGPGISGQSNYRPFFSTLKKGGYVGNVSVEALAFPPADGGKAVVEYLRREWSEA